MECTGFAPEQVPGTESLRKTWDGLTRTSGNVVTLGSLFHKAVGQGWQPPQGRGRPRSEDPGDKTLANRRSLMRGDSDELPEPWMRLPRQDRRETYDLARIAHFCSDMLKVFEDGLRILTWRGSYERHSTRDLGPVEKLLSTAYRRLLQYARDTQMGDSYADLIEFDAARFSANHLAALTSRLGELADRERYPQIEHLGPDDFDNFAKHPVLLLRHGGAVDLTRDRVLTVRELAELNLSSRDTLAVDYDPTIRHRLADNLLQNHYPDELLDMVAFAFAVPASHHFATLVNSTSGAGKTTLVVCPQANWGKTTLVDLLDKALPGMIGRCSAFISLLLDERDLYSSTRSRCPPRVICSPFRSMRINGMLTDTLLLKLKDSVEVSAMKARRCPGSSSQKGDGGGVFIRNQEDVATAVMIGRDATRQFKNTARIPGVDTRRSLETSREAHQVMLVEIVRRARAIYQRVIDPSVGLDKTIDGIRWGTIPPNKPLTHMVKARVSVLSPTADPAVAKVREFFRLAIPGDPPMLASDMPDELRILENEELSRAMFAAFRSETSTQRVDGRKTRVWTNVALFEPQMRMSLDDSTVYCVECGSEGVPPEGVDSSLFYCEGCLRC